jgi:kynureninase
VTLSRADLAALDAGDPLARHRDAFALPPDVIYLDGNSLGPLPKAVPARLAAVAEGEWGQGLIRSWNAAAWIDLPGRIGDKIARLIGARTGEVIVADSTSINLFKVLAGALALNPGRHVVLSEPENFPTDLYVIEGLLEFGSGGHSLRLAPPETLSTAIDTDTAVVALTHVNYRSGAMHDLAGLTSRAHQGGALVVWDLAHSVGAMPLDVMSANVDFAVGCGYKYLNGGPGAPAFVYVAERHQASFRQPLTGWLGHAAPFAFEPSYRPAPGIGRCLCGTPPVLSLAALEVGVDLALEADLVEVRRKSTRLGELFVELVEERCAAHELSLASPRASAARGSQVSFRHRHGYPIVQALIARGVIGDFRAPDLLRFGLAPLYLRYVDVWDAVAALADVLDSRAWDRADFHRRHPVT